MSIKIDELRYILNLDSTTFFANLRKVQAGAESTRKDVEKPLQITQVGAADVIKNLAAIGSAFLGLQAAQESFRRFQTNLTNVATLGVKNIDELKQGVLALGIDTPVALESLEKGLYDVVSAGVDAADQLTVLETSAKAAKAGLAETSEALGLASAVVKSYGKDWSESESILDRAFKTVELGSTTFKDLATNVQNVTPIASALNVSVDELFGSFATLTGVTGNTSVVSTQLRSIFTELARPTENLSKLITGLGFSSVEAAVKQEGLNGILQILQRETEGSAARMTKLFSSVESVTALLALTGEQYDTFVDKTNQMTTATGSLDSAFEKQSQTIDSQLQTLRNRFEVITIGLLEGTLPALNLVLDAASRVVGGFARLDTSSQQTILAITGISIALAKLPAILNAVRLGIQGLTSSTGLGLLVTILGTAITAFASYRSESQRVANDLITQRQEFERLTKTLLQYNDKQKLSSDEASRKKTIIDELNKKYPQFLKNIDLEKATNEDLYKAIKQSNDALQQRIRTLAFEEDIAEATKEAVEAEKDYIKELEKLESLRTELSDVEDPIKATEKFGREIRDQFGIVYKEIDNLGAQARNAAILQIQKEIEAQQLLVNAALQTKTQQISALDQLQQKVNQYKDSLDNVSTTTTETNTTNTENNTTNKTQTFEELDLQVRLPDQSALDQLTEFYGEYRNIQLEFEDLGYQDLVTAYNTKQLLFDENLNYLRQKEGENSEAYKAELKRREQMQANYNTARISLEQKAAIAIISLGAQLMSAFAGQSKTLFGIGKNLAIAEATINAYQSITRAFKDYPWPFNIAVAAIQGALAFAQVKNIASTQFNPAGGKATGGIISDEDLTASPQTPPGEDGIIGIQRGEYVVNRRSVQKYLPIIEAINSDSREAIINTIAKFATGGQVTQADVLQLMLLPSTNNAAAPGTANITGDNIDNITNNAGASIANFITSYSALTQRINENPELAIPLPRFATGGKVTQADVLQSIFTPSGESGIIGVQTGEYIVNAQATARFLPLLEAVNSGQDIRRVQAFADGGVVDNPQPAINATATAQNPQTQDINLNVIAGVIQDAVIEGFERSKLRITGTLTAQGKDLQKVLDNYENLKTSID